MLRTACRGVVFLAILVVASPAMAQGTTVELSPVVAPRQERPDPGVCVGSHWIRWAEGHTGHVWGATIVSRIQAPIMVTVHVTLVSRDGTALGEEMLVEEFGPRERKTVQKPVELELAEEAREAIFSIRVRIEWEAVQ